MNLKEFARSKGTNIKQIATKTGIAPTTLYAISSGETALDNVGISLFITLSECLNCTTDELYSTLNGSEAQEQTREHDLIAAFRMLDVVDQETLIKIANALVKD